MRKDRKSWRKGSPAAAAPWQSAAIDNWLYTWRTWLQQLVLMTPVYLSSWIILRQWHTAQCAGCKRVVQMRNWTTRRNKVILAGFLMTEETSLQLGELRNEEWGGGKACCFQLLSWFSFSLKMYLNSSRQEAGARLSFYHAAYSVFTNPCSPKILAIIIQLQGTYLFTALLCITTCPQGSTSERKRRRKEQRMNEIIIISWFMKGCFFSVVFV